MIRTSVGTFGSPLDNAIISLPEARASRTRSDISTVAEGLSVRDAAAPVSGRDVLLEECGEAHALEEVIDEG